MKKTTALSEAFEEICLMEGPLSRRLGAYAAKLRELNYPFAEAYDDLVARLIAGNVGAAAPAIGEIMPSFMLPSHNGHLVSLESLLGQGPLVVSFNRGHWCPFCKIELRAMAAYHAEIRAAGADAVSIMPDTQRFTRQLSNELQSDLFILSDMDNGYALSLGLVMVLGERLRSLMRGRGLHLEEFQDNDGFCVPLPATFILARDGAVAARWIDADFRTRMEPASIVEILKTLSHRGVS